MVTVTDTLGSRIRRARKDAGLSQVRFAAALGTSQRHVVRWEAGENRPGPEYRRRIIEATGKPDLFVADEEPSVEMRRKADLLDDLLDALASRLERRAA